MQVNSSVFSNKIVQRTKSTKIQSISGTRIPSIVLEFNLSSPPAQTGNIKITGNCLNLDQFLSSPPPNPRPSSLTIWRSRHLFSLLTLLAVQIEPLSHEYLLDIADFQSSLRTTPRLFIFWSALYLCPSPGPARERYHIMKLSSQSREMSLESTDGYLDSYLARTILYPSDGVKIFT